MNSEPFVIKARGLPWSATASEVIKFFSDVNILNGEEGIHFTFTREGKPSGECFLQVASEAELQKGLAHDNEHMGKRYIEVKQAKQSEMDWVVNRLSSSQVGELGASDGVVRLRGLPYDCKKQDVASFFEGFQICPYGITLTMDSDGRPTGDAYVEFTSQEEADKALQKHKQRIGHRYIEIFKSSKADIKYVATQKVNNEQRTPPLMNIRPGPYDRPPQFGGRARGRGGMNLGPSGFNNFNSGNFGSNYDNSMRSGRGGKGFPMRGGSGSGGRPMGGGGMNNRMIPQNSKTGHSVHMRGLPFDANADDVLKFFAPLSPVDIRILKEPNGRPKGEADVDFATHADAEAAMRKDKQNMAHRYIELFLKSNPNAGGWSNNNMNMNNNNRNNMGGGMGNMGGGRGGGNMGYGGGYGGYGNNMGGNMGGNNMGMSGGSQNNNFSGYTSFGNENVSYPGNYNNMR